MDDYLVRLLVSIIEAADRLLLRTTLNELQRQFVHSIFRVSTELRDTIITMPDLSWEKAQEMFRFEVRDQLTAIIGYAEVLLEETEGDLSGKQRELAHQIRSSGKQLLLYLTQSPE